MSDLEFPVDDTRKVLNALEVLGALDEFEIARATGLDLDVVRTRIDELAERGLIEVAGHRLNVE